MTLEFEYGHGTMNANLPEDTDVFVPGETVKDPPFLADPYAATLESLRNPIGMAKLSDSAKKGDKVTIIFPDRVKGGTQETAHRKVSIKLILDELYSAGVEKKDILLICSNGLHRKNTEGEIFELLGKEIFHAFWSSGQIINHDSEDNENMVDLGKTRRGDPVLMNKFVFESDIAILIGHVQGNPYGGYSGGYKHPSTGITHWRSIAGHHVPDVMHRADFVPVSNKSLMRTKFDEIGMHMEEKMGKKFFCCDAVLDTKSRQIAVFSGYAAEMQSMSWDVADKRTFIPWAEKKYDVVVFGMPQFFHYGNGMGTNPIFIMQAISAQVIRHKRILSKRPVIICASTCNGYFHDEEFPAYREVYEQFQRNYCNTLPDMNQLGEYFATRPEYIEKYRYAYGFHPFHAFSMISCGHIAEEHAAAIYIVGAQEPGFARGMGLKTRATFEDALADAKKKFLPESPNILALPRAFKTSAVHLMMKDDVYPPLDRFDSEGGCGC